ncbi:hypothetical protein CBS101457_006322 [Exobasidium rhododendri]|nr:hypothetical protein CBS101457_006322 [Exobasidium rhododendri]
MVAPLHIGGSGAESTEDSADSIDMEKGEKVDAGEHDHFPRTETVRYNEEEEAANRKAVASAGIGLPRTLTLERPRFEQKNKVIGDFKTLSIQLSQGGLADGTKKSNKKKKQLRDIADLDWHRLTVEETLTRLGVNQSNGLDTAQAKRRLDRDGPNVMSKPPNRWLSKLFKYVFGGFGSLLTGAAIVCFIAWRIGEPKQASNLALGVILFVVVAITALFNAWQDFTTSRVMESVRGMLPSDVPVLRNGTIQIIPAVDVVRGDIINCKMGAKMAADCRTIQIESELKFDRSSLTGESDAIAATLEMTEENFLESRNILLAGTKCVAGDGLAIVVATGDASVFGRLAKTSSAPKTEKTTLEKEISWFVITIASLAAGISIICIIIWAAFLRPKHRNFMSVSALLVNVVSILVSFIPEGLPCAVSLSLTVVAAKMRKAKVLVKSLSIVETLGAVNVVCSDKTGTLTQNKMFVGNCAIHGFKEDEMSEVVNHIAMSTPIGHAFSQLAWVAAVCNAAKFDQATLHLPTEQQNIFGDATDTAILRFAEQSVGVEASKQGWETVQQLAFNSKNKFAIRLMETLDDESVKRALPASTVFHAEDQYLALVKGAPDVLMSRCTMTVDASGQELPLTSQRLEYLAQLQNEWASKGQRVLLLARRVINKKELGDGDASTLAESQLIDCIQQLTIVGLVGIIDPPRPEIPSVVKTVRRAGSRFFMVTGDFQATAVAIARQCGIITSEEVMTFEDICSGKLCLPKYWFLDDNDSRPQRALSLTGTDIQKLQPHDWEQVCNFDEIVFSRTTPDQKLRIVKEFQQRDGVVAMTGDGVNDAPALKQADCGIAMGGPGASEVAIEAADMVLLESFSAFVDALLYGRLCFDNLKKTVAYLLPAGTFSELWAVLLSFFFGLPQALSNIQMILICVLTDLFPSLSLIQEEPESDVLLRKPRNTKTDRLANIQLLGHAYAFVGIPLTVTSCAMTFWYMERRGIPFSDMWLTYGEGVVQTTRPDYFNQVLYEANAIYFFNLIIMQYFDLHSLRTRRLSLFQQWPYWGKARNLYIIPAIIASFSFAIFFSYVPAIQRVFLTRGIPVEYFFLPVAFGIVLLSFDELRKLIVRTYPKSIVAKIAW